ncbi:unnamed protein product [Angiostrongylus costaricensis]|uniref:Endo/exonuclease/phosphatase domain-containing protein n=1 Tax=Angiostrongylus costaricensis TaxID=334426 RepID=A0A0R3PAT8_ANGCS|nr:unnamed protein product [Angiostrongylus costaricensis]
MNIDSYEQLTTQSGCLRLKRRGSIPALTIFVVYASTSNYDEEEVEAFYMDFEKFYREDHAFLKVIIRDFSTKIGPTRTSEERHIATHGLEWNEQSERLPEFIKATKTIHDNSQFQKPYPQRWKWEPPNGEFHKEIDHIIVNRRFRLTDVAVVPKFYTGSNHSLLRARFYSSRKGEKAAKFQKPKWQNYRKLGTSLVGCWQDAVIDNIDEDTIGSSNFFTLAL